MQCFSNYFLNHLAVVFTHYDHEYEIKRNKKKQRPKKKCKDKVHSINS